MEKKTKRKWERGERGIRAGSVAAWLALSFGRGWLLGVLTGRPAVPIFLFFYFFSFSNSTLNQNFSEKIGKILFENLIKN